jgi:hypothetical protein
MSATKKLICMLTAGTTLVLAAPVFADSGRDREHDYNREHRQYSNYDRHAYRDYRDYNRGYDRRHLLVAQRPIIVERPVYYAEPAPMAYNIGPAAIIGAVIGGYIDNRR